MDMFTADLRETLHEFADVIPTDPERRRHIHNRIRRIRRRRVARVAGAVVAVLILAGTVIGVGGLRGDSTTATLRPAGPGLSEAQLVSARTILARRFIGAVLPTPTIAIADDGSLRIHLDRRIPADKIRPLLVPGNLQIRLVLSRAPADRGPSNAAPQSVGPSTHTLADIEAIVGTSAYQQADALTAPSNSPGLAGFGRLAPAEVAELPTAIQLNVSAITCGQLDARDSSVLAADHAAVACDPNDLTTKYLMGAAAVQGSDVISATAHHDMPKYGGWYVTPHLTQTGQAAWTALTTTAYDQYRTDGAYGQAGIMMDCTLVEEPQILNTITGPPILSDTGFLSAATAKLLADLMNSGPLPAQFSLSVN